VSNDNHRLGTGPGRINIITFSGAHGVGKSTLVDDLKGHISTHPDLSHRVLVVPSVSTFWFKRCQEYCRAAGVPIPQTYDDINTMGYREKMQSEMPCLLGNSVAVELNRLMPMGGGTVIVDRWFGDIATYTALEIEPDKALKMNSLSEAIYQDTLSNFNRKANGYSGAIYLTHVFVPVASCKHEMPRGKTDDKAHRGTQAVDLWESTYARVNVFTEARRTLVLTSSDRLRRVEEVASGAFG
jgi:hypothetical protein